MGGKGGAGAALWGERVVSAPPFLTRASLSTEFDGQEGASLITIFGGLAGYKGFTDDGASTAEPHGAASAGHGGWQAKNIRWRAGVEPGWATLEDRRPASHGRRLQGGHPYFVDQGGAVVDEEMIERGREQFGEQLARSRSAGEGWQATGLHRSMERVRLRTESASGGARRLAGKNIKRACGCGTGVCDLEDRRPASHGRRLQGGHPCLAGWRLR